VWRYLGNGPIGSDASAATAPSNDSSVAIVPADSSDRRDTRISRSSNFLPRPGVVRELPGMYASAVRKSSITKHQRAGPGSDLCVAIGRELRRRRRARGMTQASLGAPLTRGFVSAVEHGHTVPSLPALALLAERLEISLAEFFSGVNAEMTVLYTRADEHRPDPPPRCRR
jgi:ribosome-binding protein aMBF1 (putative translation factor)